MLRMAAYSLVAWTCLSHSAWSQTREEKVRRDREKVVAEGRWIYNDVPRAFAEAARTGKPIVAVLRCLPCVECVKLDDDLIDADARIQPLLERFVPLRIVSTNGLDLSLFQFDTDQSFAVFFLRDEQTIYGRFGTRSHRTEWIGDVSIDGLARAMEAALALHANHSAVNDSLAGKRGPEPRVRRPEQFPSLKDQHQSTLNYEGNVVKSCIHCHQIGDAMREELFGSPGSFTDEILFPYPHPKSLGLMLDPKECATITQVEPESPAAQAGFQSGDRLQTLNGQPLISTADVQWVLHRTAGSGATLPTMLKRGDRELRIDWTLRPGWRQRDDIAWRVSSWTLRRQAMGGIFAVPLSDDDRAKLKLPTDKLSLAVQHVGVYSPHNIAHLAGVKNGDVLVGIDGRTDLLRETDLLVYSLRTKKRGDALKLDLLRDGQPLSIELKIP